ncbi:MAG TPA: PspC domain-containing protein [Acidimicrobiales bacterium]|nr:PspC domain-containing protein [Acidimicrobiales bacterium]
MRRPDDRVFAGVCAGIARWLGVDPTFVRIAVVLLSFANGVGVVAYVVAWLVIPEVGAEEVEGAAVLGAEADAPPAGYQRSAAVVLMTLGTLLLVRWVSPFFPDHLVWPAACGAVGLGILWSRSGDEDRARWRDAVARLPGDPFAVLTGKGMWLRFHIGGLLLIAGLGWFFAANPTFDGVGQVGLGMLVTACGIALLLGPWIVGLARQLRDERGERIRSEERADMAAHLHDSVLQTLALIQRHAESPQQSRSLARRQERELRAWLFDARNPDGSPASLAAALDRLSNDIEADHDVTVDVVAVGDLPLDEHLDALVAALREAAVNAAKHSGEPEVSVYVEVEDGAIEAFVRDRGKGFDPSAVYGDRRGIADSIIGRMARHGGTAKVRSAPGEGTEVTLRMSLHE